KRLAATATPGRRPSRRTPALRAPDRRRTPPATRSRAGRRSVAAFPRLDSYCGVALVPSSPTFLIVFDMTTTHVKKVIVWARAHPREHGGDPDRIVLAGSSFGARLATLAGFTVNDPAFPAGLRTGRHVSPAVVGLYGY